MTPYSQHTLNVISVLRRVGRRGFALLSAMVLVTVSSAITPAQPVISYMTPDVGAPGMTVAIDIIAPNTANVDGNNFSTTDDIFLNNASDGFRLECVRPADKAKVTFSPIVVSWNGRLLSTVAFISPTCFPNSTDWRLLADSWRIPVQVITPNFSSNVDTFYIVSPTHVGDLSSVTSTVFGSGGSMGIRSRRGAMVVDSIILKNASYTFSTSDPDGNISNGNQGYLPVVLLAQGRIAGSGSSSRIVVDATNVDGGPGGGGGAGAFCDDVLINSHSGTPGGAGYTGGGRGGRNGTAGATKSFSAYGQGSGSFDASGTGNSLNKTLGPVVTGYEAAGGGTGHPFGSSGSGCVDGVSCNPQGAFGGASGGKNTVPGAAGGHKTKGTSTNSPAFDNGGQVYGNLMNVPLGGGSGGAGGNPQAINNCAGNGGGGGGAISVYARSLSNLTCSALGANGNTGIINGGSGSGGAISLSAKLSSSSIGVAVAGGKGTLIAAGGNGRVRTDGSIAIDASKSDAATDYNGPTIDTITVVKGPFTLSGRGSSGATIAIYMKSDNSPWAKHSSVVVSGSNTWSTAVNYGGIDQNLYFIAAQEVVNPNKGSNTAEPNYILSSAAAATVNIVKVAEVSCDAARSFGNVNCTNGGVRLDTFYVRNMGTASVVLDSAAFATGTLGFSIDSPKPMKSITINAKDSIRVIVRFQLAAFQAGTVKDRMIIHFPIGTIPQVLTVDYTAIIDTVGLSFINVAANTESRNPTSIDFGRVCATLGTQQVHAVRNISKNAASIKTFKVLGNSGIFNATLDKTVLPSNDTAQFHIRVTLGAAKVYYDTLQISMMTTDSCTMTYRIPLSVTLVDTKVNGYDSKQEDFGYVKVGKTVTRRFVIRNTGSGLDSAFFRVVPTVSAPWSLSMVAPDTVPRVLAPGDSIVFILSFTPDSARAYSTTLDWLVEELGASCPAKVSFHPRGVGTASTIIPSLDTVRYGIVFRCTVKRDSFWIKNTGNTPGKVYGPAQLSGPDAVRYKIVKQPTNDSISLNTLADSVLYIVEFAGDPADASASVKSAQIAIRVFDDSSRTIIIPLHAQQIQSKLIVVPVAPFNNAPVNSLSSHPLEITNPSDSTICITDIKSQHSEVNVVPNSLDVISKRTVALAVNVIPKSLADINDTLTIYLNCPCIDSIKVPILVHPSNNVLQFNPTKISFDTVKPCQVVKNIRISVNNIDPTSQGFLDTVYLGGMDAKLFNLTFSFSTFPYVVAPKGVDSGAISVSYNGAGTPAGQKDAFVVLRYHINNQNFQDTIPIFAYRLVPLHLDSLNIDFGSVKQGQNKTLPVTVYNDYVQSLEVSFVYSATSRKIFQPTRPILSPPGKTNDTMHVEFIADSTGDFRDTLFVRYFAASLGCTDSIPFALHGTVLPGVNYRVWLDKSIVVDPTDTDVKIHIWAALDTALSFNNTLQFSAKVDIPADMFHALRIEDAVGRFIPDPAIGNRQTLTVTVDTLGSPLSPLATKLATISGAAMLGAQECDSLYLVNFSWTNSGVHPTTISNAGQGNGEYCTTFCSVNGKRLLGTSDVPLQFVLGPNPSSDHFNILLHSVEAGLYRFEFFNETGQCVDRFETHALANRSYEFNRSIASLSSGIYSVRMSTDTRSLTVPVVVIK